MLKLSPLSRRPNPSRPGKPVVMNYRSGEAPDHLRKSAIARVALRSVDRNVVPSRFLHDVFAGFHIPSIIVPNIVDLDVFRFRRRERMQPHLVSTRNFESLYNVSCTLRAFRRVQDRYPEARLTLVGSGSEEAALRQLAADLRLKHVRFVGRVAPSEIWRYYADADIYIQTPNIDNMPSSVLEAFATGCAVISTEAGGVPAILTDGQHGLLVPCDDPDRAAAAVCRLLEDSQLVERLTTTARESCEPYRWNNVRAQWLSLYRDLLRAGAAPAPLPFESQV